jgi:hypothetical protein
LKWTDAGPEKEYRLFRREGTSNWVEVTPAYIDEENRGGWWPNGDEPGDVPYNDFSAKDGKAYQYMVVAYNDYAPFDFSYTWTDPRDSGGSFSNPLTIRIPIAKPSPFDLYAVYLADGRNYATWTAAATTDAGGTVYYDIWRSESKTDFSSAIKICADVVDPRECYDINPPLSSEVYYKAIARNLGGETESNIAEVSLPSPLWKEILPW